MTDQPDEYDDELRDRRREREEPDALRFGGEKARDKAGDHRVFIIEDDEGNDLTEPLHVYRPKQYVLIKITQADDEEQIDLFLDEVMDEESAEYLRNRFEDPKDDLDVDHLAAPIEGLMGLWYGRPTGLRPGSSRRSGDPRRGRRSTVRRR